MNSESVIRVLNAGDERTISDLSFAILNNSDISLLKQLTADLDQIKQVALSSCGAAEKDQNRILASINRIIGFLQDVDQTGCRCAKYRHASYAAHAEAKRGLVEIVSNETDLETQTSHIRCKCTACGQAFSVIECEAGQGRRFEWTM